MNDSIAQVQTPQDGQLDAFGASGSSPPPGPEALAEEEIARAFHRGELTRDKVSDYLGQLDQKLRVLGIAEDPSQPSNADSVAPVMRTVDALLGEHVEDKIQRLRLIRAAVAAYDDPPWRPRPLDLDFESPPPRPDWIVAGLIERGTVVVLSGDTGSAKSIVTSSLVPHALLSEPWLGHDTAVERALVIDEENPSRIVQARLRALGTPNHVRDRLRYFSREGIAIGDGGRSDEWLHRELQGFAPDLVVVDTLMAACDLDDSNSNSEAVRLMKLLRGLAAEHTCGVLLLHHERKQSKDHPRSSGQAMMGARQWAGQADAHMTLTVESDFIEEETERGTFETRRTFKWRPAEKDRDGQLNRPRRLAVTSERDADKRLRWMRVEDEGPVEDTGDTKRTKILEALRDAEGDLTRPEIAAICGEKNAREPSGSFKDVLSGLVVDGKIEKPDRLRFRLTDDGRANVGVDF